MRTIKILLAVLALQVMVACQSKQSEPSLAGKWKIISATGNDGRHWTGSFTLKQGADYTGLFLWTAADGKSAGTDSIAGKYNAQTKELILHSKVITGNIENVVYTATLSGNGTTMKGIWTGSSDGTVEKPGHWSAQKE